MKRCLDENEIAQYADHLFLGLSLPPEPILSHVAGCIQCKKDILELCEIMDLVWAD